MKNNRLQDSEVEFIVAVIKTEYYNNCTEIAKYVNEKLGRNLSRRVIGDINAGRSHKKEGIEYPLSKKYARGFLKDTSCSICGEKTHSLFEEKPYCKKHWMQMWRHGDVLTETIFDKNQYEEFDDYYEIWLKNQFFEVVAKTKIDKEDFEKVMQYKWYCHQYENLKQYCQGTLEKGVKQRLHHFILNLKHKELNGKVIDHINGDSLDNRKSNLRIITQQENMQNRHSIDGMIGIRMYSLKSGKIRYSARITHNYQTISLGTFNSLEEAQEARRKGEKKYWSKK